MKNATLHNFLLIAFVLTTVSGCGHDSKPARRPVQGEVTHLGNQVDLGSISFLPKKGGLSATTVIVDGTYAFTEENGPTAGRHRVVIGIERHNRDGSLRQSESTTGVKVALPNATVNGPNVAADVSAQPTGKLVPLKDPQKEMQQKRRERARRLQSRSSSEEEEVAPPKSQWDFSREVASEGDAPMNFELQND